MAPTEVPLICRLPRLLVDAILGYARLDNGETEEQEACSSEDRYNPNGSIVHVTRSQANVKWRPD